MNFRENQCAVSMFYCTLSCNAEHNKSIDFTGLSENFLYLLVFADFQRIRFESGQRHLKSPEFFRAFSFCENSRRITECMGVIVLLPGFLSKNVL